MGHQLILLSGGQAAGKSTFASKLRVPGFVERIAFADEIRHVCRAAYPSLPWHATDQATKDAPREELGFQSMRELLNATGAGRRQKNLYYWADRVGDAVDTLFRANVQVVIVDDLRLLSEYTRILAWARDHGWDVTHIHIDGGTADYDCNALRERADYVMARKFGPERECERGS